MVSVVGLTAPGRVRVIEELDGPVQPHQVRIGTLYSGISAGTELSAYRGTSPHLTHTWDAGERLFVEGATPVTYPVLDLGYEEVGEVIELGSAVEAPSLGQRVWGTWGHRSSAVLDATSASAHVLPDDANPHIGMFSHIGAVALNTILDADIHVGETVALFGLGVPGQLAAQLARLNGARVIAVDGIAARRDLATQLGADVVHDPAEGPAAEVIRSLTDGRGADVVIEISGNTLALHEAIRSVAYNSKVVTAGFYQGDGVGLRLGEEFHHNRVQLISSQISGSAASAQHRWDRRRLTSPVIALAVAGKLDVVSLISHQAPYTDAAAAFQMLDENPRDVLQFVLDFRSAP